MRAITEQEKRPDNVRHRRVLIVDDDRDFADALAELLEFEEYSVETVYDADQIEATSRRFAPDVALIDVMLDDANGLDQIAPLRTLLPDLLCVMITGRADVSSAITALRVGADDYLRKPLDDAEVLALLKRSFDKLRLEGEKRTAELLAKRFGRILDHSSDEIYILDAETHRILGANRGALENLGYSLDELTTLSPAETRTAFGLEDMTNVIASLRVSKQDQIVIESAHRRNDGTSYPVEIRLQLSTTEDPPVLVSIALDITERKRVREQLHQALKMEAIGRLTGGVAHDFNNLLTVVLNNAELLRDRLGGDAGQPAEAVIRAALRGAELTQRLLAFARQQPLSPKVVDASALLAGMTDMLSRTLGETIRIETALPQDPWRIKADPGQLENAMLNLAINARDAMPIGGRLTIETRNVVRDESPWDAGVVPSEYVTLAVTDTGSGMAAEIAERAFDPFFSTKDVGKGSGLGLSMVYGFVKQSGGHTELHSVEGEGTRVGIFLPRVADDGSSAGDAAGASAEPQSNGETVLVVEDDPDVRTLTVALLEGLGYTVVDAANADEALSLLGSTTRVDLLLTDVVLPGGTMGPELAEKATRDRPGIGILFMSGYARDVLGHHDQSIGGVEVLQKPFRKADLARKVHAVLHQAAVESDSVVSR